MKRTILDLALFVIVVAGACLAWQTGRERSRLQTEYDRLVKAVGDMPVTDPSKVYVRAIDTCDPLQFDWRVYFPPNHSYEVRLNRGSGMIMHAGGPAHEFLARVRYRTNAQGGLDCYTNFSGSAERTTIASRETARLLVRHWNDIPFERLGANRVAVLEPDRAATLFRMKLPPELGSKVAKDERDGDSSFSLDLTFGPPGFVLPRPSPGGPRGD
jgi:hypothetical protein